MTNLYERSVAVHRLELATPRLKSGNWSLRSGKRAKIFLSSSESNLDRRMFVVVSQASFPFDTEW